MSNEERKIKGNKGYYVKNKKKIIKQFNSLVKVTKQIISPNYNTVVVEDITKQAYNELENLLSRLPYVGGDKSPFTSLMIQSAETIAFYKAYKSLGLSEREMGKLIYETAEIYSHSISSLKKWLYRKAIFSEKMKNYWRNWLIKSKKHLFFENWVGDFVESDSKSFNYGINFTECGWLKLVDKESAGDVAPYACLCDYARMRALGIGFKRTKTIAAGADMCDFRFIKDYQTPRGWPPEDLEENKALNEK
ncbi:MAG: L-2-amino-thiazoline-4-carboxylic acid hydrolase [Candidatus Lokiarchaeota archaeon]|nr:L-2-amino-thiazoline-4-carboxylic acid hydrolase [Candidatus Lokiarchaeota archaeon]